MNKYKYKDKYALQTSDKIKFLDRSKRTKRRKLEWWVQGSWMFSECDYIED